MYKVIRVFQDKDKRKYEIGEEYPNKGKASASRIKTLSTGNNKYDVPFIEKVEEEK